MDNFGMGWATFWPAVAKIAIAGAVVYLGSEALHLIRDIYVN